MALQAFTANGTLTTPGAYAQYQVLQAASGQSTTGILMLVGESNSGPDYTQEADLGANFFGPTESQLVINKYGSGRIVDAFGSACSPSNDPQITGTFAGCIIVKTNPSVAASVGILNYASTNYGTLQAKLQGAPGNQIFYQLTAAQAEVVPTTGSFALMLPINSTNISLRVNGGSTNAVTFSALETPAAMATALNVTGVTATGGTDLLTIGSVTGTLALAIVSGNAVTITYSVNWQGVVPVAGATLYIPAASVLASVHANNAGSYIVTAASATTISATKLLDVTGAHNALTPPTAQVAISVASTSNDLKCYAAVVVSNTAANPIDGTGKCLEIANLTSGTGFLTDIAYTLNGITPVAATWVSSTATPFLITSAFEYSVTLDETRQSDQVNNLITSGGNGLLQLGYEATTAQAVVNATTITLTFTGGVGTGSPIAITLANYTTIADLASYISSLAGWAAAPETAVLGAQSPKTLDQGTYTCCSTFTTTGLPVMPGRIKQDAYAFFTALANNGLLLKLATQATTGLPAPTTSIAFLSGGAKGASSDATVAAALNALKVVRGNFVIPLFSQDASLDIVAGYTAPGSTYTIAAIHSNARSPVLQMSTLKAKRNRQAFLAYRGTFAKAQTTAANLASARCSLNFQDISTTSTTSGSLVQFQPWMGAVNAAAMQAGGGYKAIFNKLLNINGAIQGAGDFSDQDPDAIDQTTYGRDNNFVFNSIQAQYSADRIQLTTQKLMQAAFVGQSLADISASQALLVLDSIMTQLFTLKLIAFSSDAPNGYKNAVINIAGPLMNVTFEAKEATSLYFININFTISQITQSAS